MKHTRPKDFGDRCALFFTMRLRWIADTFFAKRYGHRAVVLETVAGVPGMVAGMWSHLRSLRKMKPDDRGWIRTLLAEAENERMHLMFFIEITKPNIFERWLILLAQAIFWNFYFIMYVFFPKTAHRMIHYFEEEAVRSYTNYLEMIDNGKIKNVSAPNLAIQYYKMPKNATLRDMIVNVRKDEAKHAKVNWNYSE